MKLCTSIAVVREGLQGRRTDKCYLPYSAVFELGNYIQLETFLLALSPTVHLSPFLHA